MSFRKRIDKNCRDCTYDSVSPGTWRQQVALCNVKSCSFWEIRAKPTSPIPKSTLLWYGVDLAEFQPLTTDVESTGHE
jgi:hypothetical protein